MRTVLLSEPHLWNSTIQVGGHHYARAFLAAGWRVFFLSQPLNVARVLRGGDESVGVWRAGGVVHEGGRLINYVPTFLVPIGRALPRALRENVHRLTLPRLSSVLARHAIGPVDLLWLNGATDRWLLDEVRHQRSFLRAVDDYAGYEEYPEHLEAGLREAVRRADVVACASEPVRRSLGRWRGDVHVVRNGVDYDHFAVDGVAEPADLRAIAGPKAIYVGALSYWFDWELLADAARFRPGVQFVIIGPDEGVSAEVRAGLPGNVHLMGRRPYGQLPEYLAHCQAAFIPFRRSRLVEGVSPIKAYEFLAAGLPVVSTPWEELVAAGAPIRLAEGASEFVGALDAALADDAAQRSEYRAYARHNTWNDRFRTIMNLCFAGGPLAVAS